MQQLKEIALPPPVSWAPQTAGWWALAAAILVALVWGAVAYLRYRRRNRYRNEALAELERLREAGAVAALPKLVKRVALAAAPRKQVASLTGEPWLAFLDESYGGSGFTQGPGRVLPDLAYRSAWAAGQPTKALFDIVAEWIRKHHVRV